MRIVNFGSICYKSQYAYSFGEPLCADNLAAKKVGFGGRGLEQSAMLSKAGVEVYHIGRVGADAEPILDFMCQMGINTDFVNCGEGETGSLLLPNPAEKRKKEIYLPGENALISKEEIVNALLNFASGDWLLVQNEISNLPAIINTAHDMGMTVVFNLSPDAKLDRKFPLHLVDILAMSYPTAQRLSAARLPAAMRRNLTEKYPNTKFLITPHPQYDAALFDRDCKLVAPPLAEEEIQLEMEFGREVENAFLTYFLASSLTGGSPRRAMSTAAFAASVVALSDEDCSLGVNINLRETERENCRFTFDPTATV